MNTLVCNQLFLGSTTLWSVGFSLNMGIEVICSLNSVLYFYIFSFFKFYSLVFIINMNLWVLIAKMIG